MVWIVLVIVIYALAIAGGILAARRDEQCRRFYGDE
jgi:hypothetical protein